MEETEFHLDISSPAANSSAENTLHLKELMAKGAPWEAKRNQDISHLTGCSPQTDDKPCC